MYALKTKVQTLLFILGMSGTAKAVPVIEDYPAYSPLQSGGIVPHEQSVLKDDVNPLVRYLPYDQLEFTTHAFTRQPQFSLSFDESGAFLPMDAVPGYSEDRARLRRDLERQGLIVKPLTPINSAWVLSIAGTKTSHTVAAVGEIRLPQTAFLPSMVTGSSLLFRPDRSGLGYLVAAFREGKAVSVNRTYQFRARVEEALVEFESNPAAFQRFISAKGVLSGDSCTGINPSDGRFCQLTWDDLRRLVDLAIASGEIKVLRVTPASLSPERTLDEISRAIAKQHFVSVGLGWEPSRPSSTPRECDVLSQTQYLSYCASEAILFRFQSLPSAMDRMETYYALSPAAELTVSANESGTLNHLCRDKPELFVHLRRTNVTGCPTDWTNQGILQFSTNGGGPAPKPLIPESMGKWMQSPLHWEP